jgi:hypothetical protein
MIMGNGLASLPFRLRVFLERQLMLALEALLVFSGAATLGWARPAACSSEVEVDLSSISSSAAPRHTRALVLGVIPGALSWSSHTLRRSLGSGSELGSGGLDLLLRWHGGDSCYLPWSVTCCAMVPHPRRTMPLGRSVATCVLPFDSVASTGAYSISVAACGALSLVRRGGIDQGTSCFDLFALSASLPPLLIMWACGGVQGELHSISVAACGALSLVGRGGIDQGISGFDLCALSASLPPLLIMWACGGVQGELYSISVAACGALSLVRRGGIDQGTSCFDLCALSASLPPLLITWACGGVQGELYSISVAACGALSLVSSRHHCGRRRCFSAGHSGGCRWLSRRRCGRRK